MRRRRFGSLRAEVNARPRLRQRRRLHRPVISAKLRRRHGWSDSSTVPPSCPETFDVWIVQIALRRPYTFVVLRAPDRDLRRACAALLTPTDIFPNINIPVISVVWTYNGLPPNDMSEPHHLFLRAHLTAQVGDIEHHRVAVADRLRRRQDLLPEERQHLRGAGAGDGRLADGAQASAAGHHAALCAELQRLQRADPAARAVEQEAAADAAVRSRAELHPPAARHRGRRRHPLALWRQGPPGPGRSRSARDAGAQRLRRRCGQRHLGAEPDPAGRRREARQVRLERRAQRQPGGARPDQRSAGQEGQRHDHLYARRRLRARRLAAADQPGARQRLARGADDDPQGRRRLHARHHRRDQVAAAAGRRKACRRASICTPSAISRSSSRPRCSASSARRRSPPRWSA